MELIDSAQTTGQAALFVACFGDLLEAHGQDRAALEALLESVTSRATRGAGSGESGAAHLEIHWSEDPREARVGPSSAWEACAVAALRIAVFSSSHRWPGYFHDSGSGERLHVLAGPRISDAREMNQKFSALAGAE